MHNPEFGMRMFPTILNIARTAKARRGRIFDAMTLKTQMCKELYTAAIGGMFNGTVGTAQYMANCAGYHEGYGAQVVYTRDSIGRQMPYYNWHLALSFVDPVSLKPEEPDETKERPWVEVFFGDEIDKVFREVAVYLLPNQPKENPLPLKDPVAVYKDEPSAFTVLKVSHYRLYLDEDMKPMEPPELDISDKREPDEAPTLV